MLSRYTEQPKGNAPTRWSQRIWGSVGRHCEPGSARTPPAMHARRTTAPPAVRPKRTMLGRLRAENARLRGTEKDSAPGSRVFRINVVK
jgi:hypothetical protein